MISGFIRFLTALAATAVLLTSTAVGASAASAAVTTSGSAATAVDREHVRAINSARASAGTSPVRACPSLRRAAQAHAHDLAVSGVLSHAGTDGSTPGSRARSAGYRVDGIGENVAVGYPGVVQVMEAWLASPGHRANLLHGAYRHVGVATTASADGQVYWVQVFGQAGRCR
jgi:uncharacterized protein YkwD